jgi:predicted metal-dependent HD superfamily phosphohydrolase
VQDEARDRWNKLWRNVHAVGDFEEFFSEIVRHYSELHRRYHNLDHIVDCLRRFDEASFLCKDVLAVEMAIWKHDEVYEIGQNTTNEEKSGQLAKLDAKKMGLGETFGQKVDDLILVTKDHRGAKTIDEMVLIDVDLSILGRPWTEFVAYEEKVRDEYTYDGRVSPAQFDAGRLKFLESFVERRPIYLTDFFRDRYEQTARENVARSIAALEARVG